MDFFTKLGDTILDAGDVVSSKARQITEVTKLNAKIRSDESKIKETFEKIGRTIYEEKETLDFDFDFEEEFKVINRMNADIEMCREYIRAIKGTKVCPACGAEVEEGATYCKECGVKMDTTI